MTKVPETSHFPAPKRVCPISSAADRTCASDTCLREPERHLGSGRKTSNQGSLREEASAQSRSWKDSHNYRSVNVTSLYNPMRDQLYGAHYDKDCWAPCELPGRTQMSQVEPGCQLIVLPTRHLQRPSVSHHVGVDPGLSGSFHGPSKRSHNTREQSRVS